MHQRWAAALAVAAVAFALFRSTLLPGFDLGDSGSLQTTVGSSTITPRDAYPLYFALGRFFLWLAPGNPAHALNLASAVEGALACGLLVVVAAELAGSLPAGMAAALLFACSYTFWSQAIVAEVYALHMLSVAASLLLLLRWQTSPSIPRLGAVCAVYALGFGNHLSMILLAPGFLVFALLAAPGGWRSLVTVRVLALAGACAVVGALQYAWNARMLWLDPHPPAGLLDAVARFWFDVTKSDWRETMVFKIPRATLGDRASMYAFDVTQQFGRPALVFALGGMAWLFRLDRRRGWLLLALYLCTGVFAFSYNVGDTHVFFLASHLCVVLWFAVGVAATARRLSPRVSHVFLVAAFLLVGSRAYRDYPALDRSHDTRPTEVMAALTDGLDDRAIFLTDLNWQLHNGLSYFAKNVRPEIVHARLPDVLLYAPVLIRDNQAIGRQVVATERAWRTLASAYGPLFSSARDPRVRIPTIADRVDGLPPGTRYALCVLKPTREFVVVRTDLARALRALTGGAVASMPEGDYAVLAGRVGAHPQLVLGSAAPFRRAISLDGEAVEIRMESWLATDTIRRMGFGHVIAARRHALIVERGISFVAFDDAGQPLRSGYAAGIFAPSARYLVRIERAIVEP
jgi:hypothetical protein